MVGGFRSEALFKSGLPAAVRLAAWQAFEREGKGRFGKASFRRERNARGVPRVLRFAFLPFPSLSNAYHAGHGSLFCCVV